MSNPPTIPSIDEIMAVDGDDDSPHEDPRVGRVLAGKYRLDEQVGEGGMGVVYRATQVFLEKTVAVKVLQAALTTDSNFKQRFLMEARAASRFDHPNSVGVIDFGIEPDGMTYLVMEFLSGGSLSRAIEVEWPMPLARIVDILSQTLAAIAAAHDAGIVHRDLKPENIMLIKRTDEDGTNADVVKVADFGIAKIVDARAGGTSPKLTAAGLVTGTPEYMSPEQAQGLPLDGRSDLYSLGVILYELVVSHVPFVSESAIAIALKHVTELPKSPSELGIECDPGLERLIMTALSKKPDDRFRDARAMRTALRLLVDPNARPTVPVAARTSVTPGTIGSTVPKTVRQDSMTLLAAESVRVTPTTASRPRPYVWIASLVIAVIVIGVTIGFRKGTSGPTTVASARAALPTPTAVAAAVHFPLISQPISPILPTPPVPVVPPTAPIEPVVPPPPNTRTNVAHTERAPVHPVVRAGHTTPVATNTTQPTQTVEPTPTPTPAPTPPPVAPVATTVTPVAPAPVAAVAAPPIAPAPVALPTIRGSLTELSASNGVTRGTLQGRASSAASALGQCITRVSHQRGTPVSSASEATATIDVRDRRIDDLSLHGGPPWISSCASAIRSNFEGDLPAAENSEYSIRLTISLSPQN